MAASHLEVISRRGRTRINVLEIELGEWKYGTMWEVKLNDDMWMFTNFYVCVYKCCIYICVLSVKLTLSACVWRWSCTRYTGADASDAGGSGAA